MIATQGLVVHPGRPGPFSVSSCLCQALEVPVKTDVNRGQQDEEILRLRCAGLSLRAIASRVGLSHQGVSDRITQALAELVTPAAEEYRQLEAARLLDLTSRAYEVLDEAETGELKLRAVDRLTKLSESRRKLWGLDAAEPLKVSLEQRLDVEGGVVVDALKAAFDALELSPEQQSWAAYAASAAMYAASGQQPPEPPPPRPSSPSVSPVVEVPVGPRAGMEARMRERFAGEDVDVDALLAEVDGEERDDG